MGKKGNNLTDLRKHNLKVILHLLKSKNYCCSDLAKIIGLCNSGTLKILDYLSEENIIRVVESVGKKAVGRAPIYYTLNENFGYILCVDLTGSIFRILDIKFNVIVTESFIDIAYSEQHGHLYTKQTLNKLIERIYDSMDGMGVVKEKILSVCLATFGKVNTVTGEFIKVFSVEDYKEVNLKTLFENSFPLSEVYVDNDTNIAVVAESICGKLVYNTRNSLFIKVDEGISNAMFVEDKLITCGHSGLGGEIGYSCAYSSYFKKVMRLGDVITLYSIRRNIQDELERGVKSEFYSNGFTFEDIFYAYSKGDKLTRDLVFDAADMLGDVINNLMNVIDCSKTVLSGNIIRFGNEFLERVKNRHNELRTSVNVEYSSITDEIVLMGTQFLAQNMVLDGFVNKGMGNAKNT